MAFKDKFQEWRFKKQGLAKHIIPEYKIDKLIFNLAFLVFIIYFSYLLYGNGFSFENNIYIHCPLEEVKGCKNPFYCPGGLCVASETLSIKDKEKCIYSWCKEPVIEPGFEFGKKYDGSSEKLGGCAILLFSIAFLINHFLHNKGFKFNIEEDKE